MTWQALDRLDVEGCRVLVRLDLNVPMRDGVVTDTMRIEAAMPTLRAIRERGGLPVCMSHLGRPSGEDASLRLAPVGEEIARFLDAEVVAIPGVVGEGVERAVGGLDASQVGLLENLRFDPREKANDPEFAAGLCRIAERYVNDAFGSCHRCHASVVGVPIHLGAGCCAAGLLLAKEIAVFEQVLKDPAPPFVAILGGAKVSDKLPVVQHLLSRVDTIIVGGAMAYTMIAAKGGDVGASRVEGDMVESCAEVIREMHERDVDLLLPADHLCASSFDSDDAHLCDEVIPEGMMGLDIGPESSRRFGECVTAAGTVVWNGPMGVFEREPYADGTQKVAECVARAKGYTVVGGGDSAAAIRAFGLADGIDHISTGGGASLELMRGESLPGVEALSG